MSARIFCTQCGTEVSSGDNYCCMCGLEPIKPAEFSYNLSQQAFCTYCGHKPSVGDKYCAICGIECDEHVAVTDTKWVKDGTEIKISDHLDNIKDRSYWAPALVFASVAVVVGLLISLVIDSLLAESMRSFFGLMFSDFDMWVSRHIAVSDASLGFALVWLLTNLGGLNIRISGNAAFAFESNLGAAVTDIGFSFGIILLLVVPLCSLAVGKWSRSLFIKRYYPQKEVTVTDGLMGAVLFALFNIFLALFNSPLASALSDALSMNAAGGARLNVTFSPQIGRLMLSSFVISLLVALPSLSSLFAPSEKGRSIARASGATAFEYIKILGISVIIISIIGSIANLYTISSDDSIAYLGLSEFVSYMNAVVLLLMLNYAVWYAPVLSGGSFAYSLGGFGRNYEFAESGGVSFSGASFTIPSFQPRVPDYELSVSWFGYPVLIAGLIIAITAVYQTLRDDDALITKGLVAAGISAVILWIFTSLADLGVSVVDMAFFGENVSINFSSASFTNALLCALMISAAVVIVHFTRKNQELDKIVAMVAKPTAAYVVSFAAVLLIAFTTRLT